MNAVAKENNTGKIMSNEDILKGIKRLLENKNVGNSHSFGSLFVQNIILALMVPAVIFVANTVFQNSIEIASTKQKVEQATVDRFTGAEGDALKEQLRSLEAEVGSQGRDLTLLNSHSLINDELWKNNDKEHTSIYKEHGKIWERISTHHKYYPVKKEP